MLRFNFAEIRESKFKKYLQVDLLFFILVVFISYLAVQLQVLSIRQEINSVNSRISELQRSLNKLRMIKRDEKRLLSLKSKLKKKLSVVSELERKRHVPKFLYFFADPKNLKGVWLDQVGYDFRTLKVDANALDVRYIPILFERVEKEMGNVKLRNIRREVYKGKGIVLGYYHFNFDVRLHYGSAH